MESSRATSAAEAVFRGSDHTITLGRNLAVTILPVVLAPHSHDPEAVVLRAPLARARAAEDGAWAGKLGAHAAHHHFGDLGRLPHLQLNVWRVGVKGSGLAFRLPRPSVRGLVQAVTQLIV